MFDKYTDIIYKGHFDHPIRITFNKAYIILVGEGGNRHLIVGDKDGYINIGIDTHIYDGNFAFLGDGPFIVGNPSAKLVNRVWNLINYTTTKNRLLEKWTKEGLNQFFEEVYNHAKASFYY